MSKTQRPIRALETRPALAQTPPMMDARRGMADWAKRGVAAAARVLLPERCAACGALIRGEGGALCPACFAGLTFVQGPVCDRCGWPEPSAGACVRCGSGGPIRRHRFALVYADAATHLVRRLKYSDRPDLAPRLAAWMARAGADVLSGADLIAPVPIHWTRLFTRQFNQSAELARHLSRLSGIPWEPRAIARVRATPPQARLGSPAERRKNVRDAFRSRPGLDLGGRAVLLVDDVLTTGATAEACAAEFLRAGARTVDLLTVAAAGRTP